MLLCLLALAGLVASGNDVPGNDLLDQGYRDMYNLAFDRAHQRFHEWERLHPDDPMGPVSDAAAYLFFEFDRLKILHSEFFVEDKTFLSSKKPAPDPVLKRAFEQDLERSSELAEVRLRQSPRDQGALLATVLRLALDSNYKALIDKQYWASLQKTKETRTYAQTLLDVCPDCYDADLAIGVENYLLSLKSAPLRLFLRATGSQTDQATGIEKLRLVAEKGHYLKPYAKILLAIAALRNEDKSEAKRLLSDLAVQFPANDLFRDELKKLD
jgi:hypothetical protein